MLRRILATALAAGLAAGLLAAALQSFQLLPLIHDAETYETAGLTHDHGAAPVPDAVKDAADGAWMPADGWERTLYTVAADVLAGVGFALLLAACFALADGVDFKRGVVWGLAGFAVFHLAPALGLPPEIPGAAESPLLPRQIWWIGTAAATAGGLALLVFAKHWILKAAGAVLIALPHLIGAPAATGPGGVAPAELAAQFAAASLAAAAVFWAVLGGLSGYFFQAFAPRA